jgi:sulfotransferase family protein
MLEIRQTRVLEPLGFGSLGAGWRTLGDSLSRRLWSLRSEALCAEARRRTGLEDFGDPSLEPALSILVNSLELQADLHPLGRFLMRVHLLELLETRLRLVQAWSARSEALAASLIHRPIFITFMPRSGSTFLHQLLVEGPENRAPRVWEVMFPLPNQNRMRNGMDSRIRKAEASLWWFRRLAPRADSVYPMRACTPQECVAIHSYTLLSGEFMSICYLPNYQAFFHAADFGPTYSWRKRFLQHLQIGCSTKRWILKSPDHIYALEGLLAVFPDALIIQTHRDPLHVLRSMSHLTHVLQRVFGRVASLDQIGAREALMLEDGLRRIMRFRDAHPELATRFIDVMYQELVSDPLAIVRQIYQQFDIRLTEAAAERMQRVASNRSRYRGHNANPTMAELVQRVVYFQSAAMATKSSIHAPRRVKQALELNETVHLGLDGPTEIRRFQSYCSRFGINCQQ